MPISFFKRFIAIVAVIFLLGTYLCSSLLVLFLPKIKTQTAYFIVEKTDSVSASSAILSMRGGAGYITTSGGVAFNVYFSSKEAELVYQSLLPEFPSAEIHTYVKYGEFDDDAKFLLSVIRAVVGWEQVLKDGVSQQRIAKGLEEIDSMLSFRALETGDSRCRDISLVLKECLSGMVTLEKVRYFLCYATEKVWNTNKVFLKLN